ncbi:hypothetical protein BURCENBC7_AP5453 [Burkholderia cenocepacia BC7]|jgi:hypothetical protein|nr:hypothetical protein BURCENK562V_C2490 [Burkholderia cenocepacia K56-2Valvano]ERI26758.1 hypothetical protein BURCENBC7_AP5453 [Burkholderia cenocepacia BC7]
MDRAYIIAIMLNFTYFQRVSADCTRGLGRDGAELRILECGRATDFTNDVIQ